MEKPRGDLEKVLPREDLKRRDVPKANPRAQPEGLPSKYPEAFRFSRAGTFFRYHPRLWFSRGARISPKGPLWKNLGKPAVRPVHSKSQIALMENQSLSRSSMCNMLVRPLVRLLVRPLVRPLVLS